MAERRKFDQGFVGIRSRPFTGTRVARGLSNSFCEACRHRCPRRRGDVSVLINRSADDADSAARHRFGWGRKQSALLLVVKYPGTLDADVVKSCEASRKRFSGERRFLAVPATGILLSDGAPILAEFELYLPRRIRIPSVAKRETPASSTMLDRS